MRTVEYVDSRVRLRTIVKMPREYSSCHYPLNGLVCVGMTDRMTGTLRSGEEGQVWG